MDRKWKSGAAGAPPAAADNASDGYPTAGNPGVTAPTKPGPYWFHMVTEELLALIAAAGIALDKTSVVQVLAALRRLRGTAARVVGADCKNNAVTPDTQFDLGARQIVLRDPASGDTFTVRNPAVKTVNIATAGPAANGRDQAGAFAAGSWVHFYWIGKIDGTFEGIASAAAEDVGPTLPATYTHWAYAGAVRLSAGGALLKSRIKGAWVRYEAPVSALAAGGAVVETAVSLATQVPPNALEVTAAMRAFCTPDASGNVAVQLTFRLITTIEWILFVDHNKKIDPGAGKACFAGQFTFPNIGQQLLYIWTATTGSALSADLLIQGYKVPNGGE